MRRPLLSIRHRRRGTLDGQASARALLLLDETHETLQSADKVFQLGWADGEGVYERPIGEELL